MSDEVSPRKLRKRGTNILVAAGPARQIIRWRAIRQAALRGKLERRLRGMRSYRPPFVGDCMFDADEVVTV